MENGNNRVEERLHDWVKREERFKELFGPNVTQLRHFDETKLMYLRDMSRELGPVASKDEKLALNIVKGEIRRLERKLTPSLIGRLFQRAMRSLNRFIENNRSVPAKQPASLSIKKPVYKEAELKIPKPYVPKKEVSFNLNEKATEYKKETQKPLLRPVEKDEGKQRKNLVRREGLLPKNREGHSKSIRR